MANIIVPSELSERVNKSIERLKAFDPSKNGDPYYLAFSGGKDSVVVKALMDMAGVKYRAAYRHTSVDHPELVTFIKDKHKDVEIDYPVYSDGSRITMWNLIQRKLSLPTRLMRFCCDKFKETGGIGNLVVTGVRWDESYNRSKSHGVITAFGQKDKPNLDHLFDGNSSFSRTPKGGYITNSDNDESRMMLEKCYRTHKTTLNPIVDWKTGEVWNFIRSERIPYCCLYDEGWDRLGCILCPMGSRKNRLKQLARWPTYGKAYLNAIRKMLELREQKGKPWPNCDPTPQAVFRWWLEDKNVDGQTTLFQDELYEDAMWDLQYGR